MSAPDPRCVDYVTDAWGHARGGGSVQRVGHSVSAQLKEGALNSLLLYAQLVSSSHWAGARTPVYQSPELVPRDDVEQPLAEDVLSVPWRAA